MATDKEYSDVCLIIDAFEKAAMRTQTREGFLAVANGPLESMDHVLAQDEAVAVGLRQAHSNSSAENNWSSSSVEGFESLSGGGSVSAEVDPAALLDPLVGDLVGDSSLSDWLERCVGCSGRIQFAWEMPSFDMVNPMVNMANDLIEQLNLFSIHTDPMRALNGLCKSWNQLSSICMPDWISLLMGLKLMMKQYTSQAMEISLDWTVLVGPLLKAIVQGIAQMVNSIRGTMLAPFDCMIDSMRLSEEIEQLTRDVGSGIVSSWDGLTDGVQEFPFEGEFNIDTKTVNLEGGEAVVQKSSTPAKETTMSDTFDLNSGTGMTFPSGFTTTADTTLETALNDEAFGNATFLQKILVASQDLRKFINDLAMKIITAVQSLTELVGGGIKLNLGKLGILVFLADIVGVIVMMIRMFKERPNELDWCKYLQDNPEALEDRLNTLFHIEDIKVRSDGDSSLVVMRGPDVVQRFGNCTNYRGNAGNSMVEQWIAELESRGS